MNSRIRRDQSGCWQKKPPPPTRENNAMMWPKDGDEYQGLSKRPLRAGSSLMRTKKKLLAGK